MCKFNQNLFLITIFGVALIKTFNASPVDFALLDELIDEPSNEGNLNRDLTYDQRQNGTENLRLNVDGVIIAIPSSSSNQASSAVGNLAANYLLQLAASSDDDDDDYYPFLKNSNGENAITAPNDKETAVKDEKNSKKKSAPAGASVKEPPKDNNVKQIVVVKETVKDVVPDAAGQQSVIATIEEQSKVDVIPVKKVQSRRKNK